VWTSIVSDDDFDPSRPEGLEAVGRFCILGAYTALHGNKGVVDIAPATLFRLMNVQSLDEIRGNSTFTNVSFEEGKNRYGKVTVTWQKWQKYQVDSTVAERMRELRSKKRREEKRGEERRGDVVPKKTRTSYPDDFVPSERTVELSAQHGWPDPVTELAAFKDYHESRGSTFLDWEAAFRTWLRTGKRMNSGKKVTSSDKFKEILQRGLK